MSKDLYEEALADVKRVTEVAEDNAKRDLLEAVTPRIKRLIEQELLNEFVDDETLDDPGFQDPNLGSTVELPPAAAITVPDAEGKVTLDLDALNACDPGPSGAPVDPPMFGGSSGEEYVLGLESLDALAPVLNATGRASQKILYQEVVKLASKVKLLKSNRSINESSKQIAQMISRIENMYDYVQERITDPATKKVLENKLETYFYELQKLQELKMSKKLRDLIKEDDMQLDAGDGESSSDDVAGPGELTLKLTGLPDDVDLDSVGVDLVADDNADDEEVVDDGSSEDSGEDGDDLGDLDLGGLDEPGEQMESMRLSDDTIVEIDEGVLRREIARMKAIREAQDNSVPSNAGQGVDADAMDDFGGGSDDGEAFLDGEVTTESEEMDEGDELEEMQNRRKADSRGVSADSDMGVSHTEGLKRRIAFEKRLQERAKLRAASLKKEAARSKPVKKAQLQKEYAQVASRHNASVKRSNKFSKLLSEAKNKNRSNSVSQPAESKAVKQLRKQLAERSLLNVQLVYANKLMQNESLSRKQKAQIIERLDETTTIREAKLVYDSLTKTLANNKPLRENKGTQVLGSSSRATSSGSTKLNEGFETDRWATLAGITKR